MTLFHSLWVKLLAAFMLVVVVAVGMIAIVSNQATTRQFQIYVSRGKQQRAERLAPTLAAYYSQTGSWDGVTEWLADLATGTSAQGAPQASGQARGMGRGRGQAIGYGGDRLLVVDTAGTVLADSLGTLVGESLPERELALGVPIAPDGETIGILLIPSEGSPYETAETEFLRHVNRALLWAGLASGAVALILGVLLARQLTAPLRALTHAARSLTHSQTARWSERDVPQVEIHTQDEIGELGQAFNQMAGSLAQQEHLRRNLMADIAHELRTPLSVIRGDLEALLDGVYEPTPDVLASLQEESLLLSRLVDDLRALALAEAGQLQLERELFDLGELLHGIVTSFRLQAESKEQSLALDLPPGRLQVAADAQRVRQVVANLISNALRHAPEPGNHVLVSALPQESEVMVSVADDGPGIAPEEVPYVFDRFWQSDGARVGGSGLGLAIARELVRAHGGRIWVESHPGEGTTFRFTLPQVPGQDA
jgi:two-component system OmpR family sensor kinase/two-component system sensor histidine kinase BaeS